VDLQGSCIAFLEGREIFGPKSSDREPVSISVVEVNGTVYSRLLFGSARCFVTRNASETHCSFPVSALGVRYSNGRISVSRPSVFHRTNQTLGPTSLPRENPAYLKQQCERDMISIVICTYNNAPLLHTTLQSVLSQAGRDSIPHEVIVVDNNSSDNTREVVTAFRQEDTRIRYVHESRQGLSHARNRGMAEALGDVVSYIDDDVLLCAQWLENVVTAFSECDCEIVGGRCLLSLPHKPPAWFYKELEHLLSMVDHGDERLITSSEPLYGLNFSIRKETLRRVGGFDPKLGRQRRTLLSGEEREVLHRVRMNGGTAVYEPRALLYHIVNKERLTAKWFFRRKWAQGRSDMRCSGKLNIARHLLRIVRSFGGLLFVPLSRGERKALAFRRLLHISYLAGSLFEGGRRLTAGAIGNFRAAEKTNRRGG